MRKSSRSECDAEEAVMPDLLKEGFSFSKSVSLCGLFV
jgi:hypothetical protein